MSIIVNEIARNVSSALGFYRAESYSLAMTTINGVGMATATLSKTWSVTFANAGNLRGIFMTVSLASAIFTPPTRSIYIDLEETKGTVTFNTTTEKILQAGHGLNDGDIVRFTSTGTLPTGIVTGQRYYIVNKGTDDYQISTSLGGSVQALSGTPTGTATHWVTRSTATKTANEIRGTNSTYTTAIGYGIGFLFTPYAVDATASKWRFTATMGAGVGSWYLGYNSAGTIPFHVAWCDTAVSYSNTNDLIVSLDTLTVDTDYAPKCYTSFFPTTDNTTAYGVCGYLATPADGKRGWEQNCMLTVDGGNRTITIDGSYILCTQAGVYIGTEDVPIPSSQLVTINFLPTPTIGKNRYCQFADVTHALSYYGGGVTLCFSGTAPTKRYATLTADALNGQKDVVVDDATGFTAGDKVYISKHDSNYTPSINATLYEIASIAGNTITLTTNITTTRLGPHTTTAGTVMSGGRIVKIGGYSVILQSTVVTAGAYANGFRFHGITNLFMKGCWTRGIAGTCYYSSAYRTIDNLSDVRPEGMYIGFNLFENPSKASTASAVFGSIVSEQLPLYIEDNLATYSTIAGSISKIVMTPAAGITWKSNSCYFRRNFIFCASNNAWSTAGTSNSTTIAEYNIAQHASTGITIGGTASIARYNESYAPSAMMGISSSFNCLTEYNVTNRALVGISFGAASISSGCISRFDEFTSPVSYFAIFLADLLYDYLFDNCKGNLTNNDFTLQSNMVTGTKFRIVNNNETANDDIVYTPEGDIVRCGVGLADTTCHTADGFSMRFAPIDSTTMLNWTQTIPTGNIQNKEMTVSCWVKINNANYYTGVTNQKPRLYITYDNSTTVYVEATATTDWQLLTKSFTPTTTYGQVVMKVDCSTNALTTDKYVYLDDINIVYPTGYYLSLGSLDSWANASPVMPTITQAPSSAISYGYII